MQQRHQNPPLAPIGCPKAIAPPLIFNLPISIPNGRAHAKHWAAKASLSSNRSMSATVSLALASTASIAPIGAVNSSFRLPRKRRRGNNPPLHRRIHILSDRPIRHDNSRRPIANLRSVPRRGRPLRAERRPRLSQRLTTNSPAALHRARQSFPPSSLSP